MKEWNWEKNNALGFFPDKLTCGVDKKVWWQCNKGHEWIAAINKRVIGRNCPVCSNKLIIKGTNDLTTTHPKLVKEWDYEKNVDINPEEVSFGSTKNVYWLCKLNHSYKASICDRVRGNGCPYCAGKKIKIGFNDLKTTHPRLANEWNYEKNGCGPETVTKGCTKQYWWKCDKGHSWRTTPNHRTSIGTNCPYCTNRKIFVGFNDLATEYPEIAREWNYDKNKITPQEVVAKSNKKVWWICKFGHEYMAQISTRTCGNGGCPICNKERQTSFPEKTIFYYLSKYFSDAQENVNFEWLGKKELDIYIPSLRIGVEYDGYHWHQNINKDLTKDNLCERNNIQLIRIRIEGCPDYQSNSIKINYGSNLEIKTLDDAIKELFIYINNKYNLNINYDINVERDYSIIMDNYITQEKENNLAIKRPDLAKEWDYSKNGKIKPEFVSLYSNKHFWWICPKNHSYKMSVNDRTGPKHSNCPICANKRIIKGINDLATTNANLMDEWMFDRNTLSPYSICKSSHKKIWWKCKKCNYEWQTDVYVRAIMNCGCPKCSHQVADETNNFAVLFPELLKEWNYDKNERDPHTLLPNSNLKFWWKCKDCGHEWQTDISHRTSHGRGCPLCAHQVLVKGINDLETQFPEVAKEWNYQKNILKPYEVSGGTNKKYWWKCSKCGYEWECVVASRTKRNSRCPMCRKK